MDIEKEQQMAEFVREYGDDLLRMCFLYLHDLQQAEDAVQDTFLKAYMSYAQFRGEASVKTWLMRIAMNTCKNYLRKHKPELTNIPEILESIPCGNDSESSARDEYITQTVMELPLRYQKPILLYYYQGLSIKEVAYVLGIPESTVKTRLSRAKGRLKIALKGWIES